MSFFFVPFCKYNNWVLAERDQADLSECIQDYLLIKGGMFRVASDRVDIIRIVADFMAANFYGKNKSGDEITDDVETLIEELKNRNYISSSDARWQILQDDTTEALLVECQEDSSNGGNEEDGEEILSENSYDSSSECSENEETVSESTGEPEDVAEVLNLILVRWMVPPRNMIRTREGRALLRGYVNRALERLRVCLSNYDHERFRILLRALWNRRAQRYFSSSTFKSYPYNAYFSYDESTNALSRSFNDECYSLVSWSFRNSQIPRSQVDKILNIHILGNADEYQKDVYAIYDRHGMGRADYFFEKLVDQFYRIILFFLELRARGIMTDEDDTYQGYLPHEVLSANISMIVRSDFGYSSYLLKRRHELLREFNGTKNKVSRSLENRGRVWEENLIWLMMSKQFTDETYSTTTISTTTSLSGISSTSRSISSTNIQLGKRKKDDSYRNKNGKSFPKRQRPRDNIS